MTVCYGFSRRMAPRAEAQGQDVSLQWISGTDDGPTSWRELGQLDWSRFRLVLGAGGATGAAFEAGILLALAIDHGVDLRLASHVVGTSAGSVVGALIAMGLDGEDLAAVIARTPEWMSPVVGTYDLTFSEQRPPTPNLRGLMRPLKPRDMVRFAELAATRRYRALWLHCVKPGTFDITQQLPFIPGLAWPSDVRLSVCCSDSATGDRVVYERESGVNLADAVAASCAVPGVIRPVAVGDRLLVDGGVVSPTNADVALEDGEATITVIVSPMSGTGARSALGRAFSMFATRRLVSELRRSHASGNVLVIDPPSLSVPSSSTMPSTQRHRRECSVVRFSRPHERLSPDATSHLVVLGPPITELGRVWGDAASGTGVMEVRHEPARPCNSNREDRSTRCRRQSHGRRGEEADSAWSIEGSAQRYLARSSTPSAPD